MKNLGLCLLPLFAISASADLTIVQKLEGMGNSSDMTIKIKGDKIRVDPSPEMSTIMDNKSGEMTTIMHAQKAFIVIPGEQAKQMISQSQGEEGDKPAATPEPKATGAKEKIKTAAGEFEAEKFTFETDTGIKGTYWLVKDYPNGKSIMDQMSIMMKGPLGESLGSGSPDVSKLPGLPVKTVIEMEGQDPVISTIISTSEDEIPNDQFETPSGYTKMDMPGGE